MGPHMDPQIAQNQTLASQGPPRTPKTAQRSPGSHSGAFWGKFWKIIGLIFGPRGTIFSYFLDPHPLSFPYENTPPPTGGAAATVGLAWARLDSPITKFKRRFPYYQIKKKRFPLHFLKAIPLLHNLKGDFPITEFQRRVRQASPPGESAK